MENWKRFLNESSEPSGPPWNDPTEVLAALAARGYESLGPKDTPKANDKEARAYIANILNDPGESGDLYRNAPIETWIGELDGEWIIHPAKEKERIEKQKQREKDPEYQKRWDRINRKQAEMDAAVGSIDWETTDLGHPKGLKELKQTP